MLAKANRLKKKKDFERIAKQGRTVASSFLVLKFLPNDLTESRVGFVCSKKVSNKAVVRNRIKRRLRESIRAHLTDLKPGYDLVFFSKQAIAQEDFESISKEAVSLLKKANLL